MAIAPLQLPGQFQSPTIDFSPLANLGQVYKKAQNEQKLSDLGKGLADGSLDYRTAAAQTAGMGDIQHTLQFLALDEQKRKESLGREADAKFDQSLSGLGSLYGAKPSAAAPSPNPMPAPGASAPIAAPATAGAPVPSSARVIGDAEGVSSGLYDPPKAPGTRPPVQVADAGGLVPAASTPSAPAAVQQPTPLGAAPAPNQVGAEAVPALLQAMSSRNISPERKEVAKLLLTEAFKNMKEPEKIQTLRAMRADPALLETEVALRRAGKTDVNVDTKGEGELSKTLGKGLGERINDIAKEGDSARTDLAMVGQLRDLGAAVKTGGPAAIQGWLANYGIKVGENVDAVEAYGSIVNKLTPNQRVPGSGSSSDVDVKMFKSSLPRLINTPGGNTIIENTLAGLAQYKLDRASIADQVQAGELTAKDGIKKMRDLPNPYDNFKTFAKTGFKADPSNPASAVTPVSDPNAAKVVPSTKVEIDQSLANARAAVQRNPAARNDIIKKLRDNGIDPSGL